MFQIFRFKDNALIDMAQDPRVTITTRPWGSRLRIKDLFTLDTGVYRCEASNGHRRVKSSAHLAVAFSKCDLLSKYVKKRFVFVIYEWSNG